MGQTQRMIGRLAAAAMMVCAAAAGAAGVAEAATAAGEPAKVVLFDFDRPGDLAQASVNADAKFALADGKTGKALRIDTGHKAEWPGITLKAPGGKWDLWQQARITMDVTNVGTNRVTVYLRVDNPGADGQKNCDSKQMDLAAGQSGTITVPLSTTGVRLSPPVKIVGMRGVPGAGGPLDPADVTQVIVFVPGPTEDHAFTIDNLVASGSVKTVDSATFFPFIDEFGQYIHADWPGKVHSLAELKARVAEEDADWAKHPGPADWDQYGGWAKGPQLKATGFFYAAKHEGKWWLVDPEGRLFWSHGIDCVGTHADLTPITDRLNYFKDLPAKDSPLGQFYGSGAWAPHGYYAGKGRYETYNFRGANLYRKYGDAWYERFFNAAHHRLRSWGMNTMGNWSSADVFLTYRKQRTPYVVAMGSAGPEIAGSSGYWGKFPDVFDEGFRKGLAREMERQKPAGPDKPTSVGDPWCLGYFIDNELAWGDDDSLGLAALASPPTQAAKKAMIEDLKAKYATIEKLNAAWGTAHESWDALLASQAVPDRKKAGEDLRAFYTHAAETYFRICKEECRRVAPNNLYLGCRFAWRNDLAVRAAAKYCDVISFNFYQASVADFRLPGGLDAPIMCGEFHFGALDRGMFHPGLVPVKDQADRARMYREFVRSALANPLFVGTHWFQYGDQASTGRGDGENYQIGFITITDTPYPETIQASRDAGYDMYEYRTKAK